MHDPAAILMRCDAGETPAAIVAALGLPASTVYGILRKHRPTRERAKRTARSDKARKIRGLAAAGIKPARIKVLCQCSRQYVHSVLNP